MIKLKNILLEIASPDIVVGFIDTDLNVVSKNNIIQHTNLFNIYPEWKTKHWSDIKFWRYNALTHTVYWYQVPDNKQADEVREEIVRKYKYNVSHNVYIGNRGSEEYMKLQAKAHGLNEIINKNNNLFLGFIKHDNFNIIAASCDDEDWNHFSWRLGLPTQWKNTHDNEILRWRYNKKLNTIYWWEVDVAPTEDEKEQLEYWLEKNLNVKYPTHKIITAGNTQNYHDAHSLNEKMSFKDLFNVSTPERLQRSKSDVRVRPLRVVTLDENEAWTFSYKSNPSVTGKPHKGYIKFFKEHVEQGENAEDLDCIVDCTCPDFMYRYAYNDTTKDASVVGPKSWNKCINRKPQPAYDFGEGMCKHLLALQGYLKTKIQPTQTRSNLFETLNGMMGKQFDVDYYD